MRNFIISGRFEAFAFDSSLRCILYFITFYWLLSSDWSFIIFGFDILILHLLTQCTILFRNILWTISYCIRPPLQCPKTECTKNILKLLFPPKKFIANSVDLTARSQLRFALNRGSTDVALHLIWRHWEELNRKVGVAPYPLPIGCVGGMKQWATPINPSAAAFSLTRRRKS